MEKINVYEPSMLDQETKQVFPIIGDLELEAYVDTKEESIFGRSPKQLDGGRLNSSRLG